MGSLSSSSTDSAPKEAVVPVPKDGQWSFPVRTLGSLDMESLGNFLLSPLNRFRYRDYEGRPPREVGG